MKKDKIFVRPLAFSDINDKYISWFKDIEVTKFLDAKNITIKDSKEYLYSGILNKSYYIYAICDLEKGNHIGNIKIGPIRRNDGISDLVTVIGDKNYWGKKMASKAIKVIIDIGFKEGGVRKFCASIDSNNLASMNAYKHAGFDIEATLINYFRHDFKGKNFFSDKVYVTIENKDFDLKKVQTWQPVNLLDIE